MLQVLVKLNGEVDNELVEQIRGLGFECYQDETGWVIVCYETVAKKLGADRSFVYPQELLDLANVESKPVLVLEETGAVIEGKKQVRLVCGSDGNALVALQLCDSDSYQYGVQARFEISTIAVTVDLVEKQNSGFSLVITTHQLNSFGDTVTITSEQILRVSLAEFGKHHKDSTFFTVVAQAVKKILGSGFTKSWYYAVPEAK